MQVIAPYDLVTTKVIAGRTKDLEDAAGIVDAQGNDLDVHRIRSVLGEIEAAFEASDLVERFNRALHNRGP